MSVVPTKVLEKIQWAEAHVDPFNTNALAIGTSVAEAAAFQSRTEAARSALTAADAARDAARNATINLKTALAALDVSAAGIIKQIRAKAETTANPNVYALASIPAPAIPGPTAPPGKPEALVVTLEENGALNLKWKCPNPPGSQGTIYQIWRRIGAAGEFVYMGGAGDKKWTDATIPAGSSQVTYQIQAVRTTAVGPWAQFNVNFGVGTGGGTTMSVSETPPTPKIAA